MENHRKSLHYTYDIKYHLMWNTKYRKLVIVGKIAVMTRKLIRMICQSNEVEILAGHVGSDHILLVSVPLHLSANKQFWGQHLWARGYFMASSWNVTDEIIKEYIKSQDLQEKTKSNNFEIE